MTFDKSFAKNNTLDDVSLRWTYLMNSVAHCCKRFPLFFRSILRSTEKIIYFLSFHFFYFISTKKSVILTLINAGLFQTFDVVEKHMTTQYSFSFDANITFIF